MLGAFGEAQVQEDVYEKLDKELLTYVEDVLLNRRADSTERLLEYAATLDPKSHPTKLRKLGGETNAPVFQAKLNPIPAGFNPVAPPEVLPPVPEYKPWVDQLAKSPAFEQLEKLFEERIAYIDGAMGTMIQRYKLDVRFPLIASEGLFLMGFQLVYFVLVDHWHLIKC